MTQYFMSFSIGLAVITTAVAVIYFGIQLLLRKPLPELHWQLGVPAACICGSLWVCGFFFRYALLCPSACAPVP